MAELGPEEKVIEAMKLVGATTDQNSKNADQIAALYYLLQK